MSIAQQNHPFTFVGKRRWEWRNYVPTPDFDTEEDMADYVLSQLSPYFDIEPQVTGLHCSGKKLRVDAVLIPHDWPIWKDQGKTALGIEFKLHRNLGGFNEIAKWVAQCVDYTHTDWNGYGKLPIFACPAFSGDTDTQGTSSPRGDDWRISHLVGQFRVGELINSTYYGWSFILNGHHRQWSQRNGTEDARRTRLIPYVGSR